MLASRLLSILMLLQARGRVSAADLSREFEVSVRTIHRDIDQLSAAGIPVYAERGRAGGFALLDGYRTKLTGLTQPEAESLFLAGLPGPAAQLGLAGVLSAARLKLMAALPPTVRPGAERIAERFHLDPVSWFRGADPLPQLKTVADAVWNERWLTLNYRNSGALYPRKLGPLGLVLKGGVWYLVAQSGKSIRTYRIAQMQDVEVTDAPFPRPRKFDLAAHWEKSSRDYERGLFREEADVRLSPKGMALLEQLGPYVEDVARKTAGKPDARGRVRCRLPIESLETGAREILRLRGEVEVLSPAALRKEIKAQLATLSKHHH
ncbi:MAG TPA: YafY family protein [Rhizomicrobium sp.]|jgi:predicted DNA-binding transcriptional regulator YafY|nr:YafY family protein [Rhizomicrobium sp.]